MYFHMPDEILVHIFHQLCFHCQNPGKFPHADTYDVRQDKKTLARLCLVSRRFCRVAQPILYHFYATGNLPDHDPAKSLFPTLGSRDHLLSFVMTIFFRWDLAAEVVSMQLINHLGGWREYTSDDKVQLKSLFEWSKINKMLSTSRIMKAFYDSEQGDLWKEEAHRWLMCLAMLLPPRLQDVLLSLSLPNEVGYVGCKPIFPALHYAPHMKLQALRTLGVMCHGTPCHPGSFDGLLRAAPKLENIYVCDASPYRSWNGNEYLCAWTRQWDFTYYTSLRKLKKLFIHNLYSNHLWDLLKCIDDLEELEYYWESLALEYRDLGAIIEHTKPSLKRLCLSFVPRHENRYRPRPDLNWYDMVGEKIGPIESLAEFSKLEDITIDFRSLYRKDEEDTDDKLTKFLPTTIRHLRIAYVPRNMTKSLTQVAYAAENSFPCLESVVIGTIEAPGAIKLNHQQEMRTTVGPVYEMKGISIKWKEDGLGACVHTAVPGATLPGLRLLPWKEEV